MNRVHHSQMGFGTVEIVIAAIVILILAAGGVLLYRHDHTGLSYQQVITKFDTAMQDGNANEVASLESSRFQNWIRNDTKAQNSTPGARKTEVTDSFYTLLKEEGTLLTFSPRTLAGAKIEAGSYQNGLYTAPKGTTGKSETFNFNAAKYGPPSYLPGLTISVVPKGNTWVVDNIVYYVTSTQN